jgi:hypothetical protein
MTLYMFEGYDIITTSNLHDTSGSVYQGSEICYNNDLDVSFTSLVIDVTYSNDLDCY